MRIGELAERAGVSTRALRHYEELGLLPAARSANGYRRYDEEHLRALVEIRTLVGLGLSLEETRPFVECLRAGHPTGGSCADSIAVYRSKLAEVDASLARLGAVRAELAGQLERAVRARCEFTLEET
ncbi:MerR family transcriptional regulator [Pseudonocardia xishanensis]|uniref:MerR family transcriptional regulator n=1 Tax=Pseudonocardia xishanensis TaxID=630995 RepID=A0ABP8S1F8_9PSEU